MVGIVPLPAYGSGARRSRRSGRHVPIRAATDTVAGIHRFPGLTRAALVPLVPDTPYSTTRLLSSPGSGRWHGGAAARSCDPGFPPVDSKTPPEPAHYALPPLFNPAWTRRRNSTFCSQSRMNRVRSMRPCSRSATVKQSYGTFAPYKSFISRFAVKKRPTTYFWIPTS